MLLYLEIGRWSLKIAREPDADATASPAQGLDGVEYVPTPMQVHVPRYVGFVSADPDRSIIGQANEAET